MEAELFHAGRRIDDKNDEANSRFSQFCKRTQKKKKPLVSGGKRKIILRSSSPQPCLYNDRNISRTQSLDFMKFVTVEMILPIVICKEKAYK